MIDETEGALDAEAFACEDGEVQARAKRIAAQRDGRKLMQPVQSALEEMRSLKPSDWSQLASVLARPSCPWTLRALLEATAALLSHAPPMRELLAPSAAADTDVSTLSAASTLGALVPTGAVDLIESRLRLDASATIYGAAQSLDLEELPTEVLTSLGSTLSSPNVAPAAMKKQSKAAEVLCRWLRAACAYAHEAERLTRAYDEVLAAQADVQASRERAVRG